MAYFRNGAINRANLHYGIQAFAQASGGAFFLAFLLRAGVSAPEVLLAQAAILAGRFVVRPIILPLAKRWGLRPLLIVGTLGIACQYPLLPLVHGVGGPLLTVCLVSSLGDVFYWCTYHAYFAALGDAEHRGHQIAAREAAVAIVGITAPLLAAWSLVALGPQWTFPAVAVVQALAAAPLIGAPNVAIKATAPGAFRTAWLGLALFTADGWFSGCYIIVWLVALFVALHESFAAFGGAMALAAVSGAVCGLVLGRHIDRGHGGRAAVLAYGLASAVVVFRALSLGSPWLAALANAAGAFVAAFLGPTLMTAVYNLAKAAPCPLRFHMAAEGGWDVGCSSACLTAAAITASGHTLAVPLLGALPGAGVTVLLLRRYFAQSLSPDA